MYFLAASNIFGRAYMGAATIDFIYMSSYSTLGGLSGMRPASPFGVCISTTGTISRPFPRPQRTCEHAGFPLRLVVEYQVHRRSVLDRRWTERRRGKGEE